jgi:serine/threonine protein kinase
MAPKTTVHGENYEIIRTLESGGMGELLLARRRRPDGTHELVAIKQMHADIATRDDAVRRFFAEARVLATLQHRNIVTLHDFAFSDGKYQLVMEFVAGRDLGGVLKELRARRQFMSLATAINITLSVCSGIHYAHERRDQDGRPLEIIHRDISPANVLISYDGVAKISDFGIAKSVINTMKTQTGIAMGKPGYMSPEQYRGEALDRRSDIFALGILIYEISTGTRLFTAAHEFDTMKRTLEDPIPRPSSRVRGYPRDLERIILKALSRERRRRYATAQELQRALQEFAHANQIAIGNSEVAQLMHTLFASAAGTDDEKTDVDLPDAETTGDLPPKRG